MKLKEELKSRRPKATRSAKNDAAVYKQTFEEQVADGSAACFMNSNGTCTSNGRAACTVCDAVRSWSAAMKYDEGSFDNQVSSNYKLWHYRESENIRYKFWFYGSDFDKIRQKPILFFF